MRSSHATTATATADATTSESIPTDTRPADTREPLAEFQPSLLPAAALRAAPEPIRERILTAHVRPLVGLRTASDGVICIGRRAPSQAWGFPILEWLRTGAAQAAIGLDLDDPGRRRAGARRAARRGLEAAAAVRRGRPGAFRACARGLGASPRPSPVGSNARRGPRRFLGRVAEYLAWATGADPGYVGVLAANPEHTDYRSHYGRRDRTSCASWLLYPRRLAGAGAAGTTDRSRAKLLRVSSTAAASRAC